MKNNSLADYFKLKLENLSVIAGLVILTITLLVGLLVLITPVLIPDQMLTEVKEESDEKPQTQISGNSLLVKVKNNYKNQIKENADDTGVASLTKVLKNNQVKKIEKITKSGKDSNADIFSWYTLTLDESADPIGGFFDKNKHRIITEGEKYDHRTEKLQRLVKDLIEDPSIETVEPNFEITTFAVPNDPYYASTGSWGQAYPDLWGIRNLNLEQVWEQASSSASVLVADIDTGVDRNHEDLKSNMWVNSLEIPGNGVDDDANGYVDDYNGWDWVNNDNDPMDDNGHGTHTVGTITGAGNNGTGVVGVNWNAKVMALKFLNSSGSGSLDAGIKALQYAADKGARVASNSWGCQCQSTAIEDAVKYAHDKGVVVVAAAGNSSQDALNFSPASSDYAITVAATEANNAKANFSNWGQKLDVAAPGVDILSTKSSLSQICTSAVVGNNYCRLSGTSMATPHVAGLAALILSKNPSLTPEEVRQTLRLTAVDSGTVGKDWMFGYGRINAQNDLILTPSHMLAPEITSPRSRTNAFGNLAIQGRIPGPDFESYTLETGAGRDPSSWTTIYSSNNQPITVTTLATVDTTKLSEGVNIIRLTAFDKQHRSFQFQVADITVDNFDASITSPAVLMSQSKFNVTGTAFPKNGLVLSNYRLEWGQGSDPSTWSTEGITLQNNGMQPVVNDTLGIWDASLLTINQQYTLRLTVTSTTGSTAQVSQTFTLEGELVIGWPKVIDNFNPFLSTLSSDVPAIADIDGDNNKEIIYSDSGSHLYAYRKDGSSIPGWPITITSGWVPNMPVIATDLNGDGKSEVIFSTTNGSSLRKIFIFQGDGTALPEWPQPQFSDGSLADDTPLVIDLNGDLRKELVLADHSGMLHVLTLSGTEISGFPVHVFPSTESSIRPDLSAVDIDNNGQTDVVLTTQNKIYVVSSSGTVLSGWPVANPTYNNTALAYTATAVVADINNDGQNEVYALASSAGCGGCSAYVFGYSLNGTVLSGWPKLVKTMPYNSSTRGGLGVADVDNDGKNEVVAATSGVFVLGDAGQEITGGSGASAPALSDIDNDGKIEVTAGYGSNVNIVDDNGSVIWSRTLPSTSQSGNAFTIPSVVADLDNNGRMEVVTVWSPFTTMGGTGYIFIWEPQLGNGSTALQVSDWPMFGHDVQRMFKLTTGSLSTPQPTIPGTPVPTVTPTPIVSPIPTQTPVPTVTPVPTPKATPVPSVPPTPWPTPPPSSPTVTISNPLNNTVITRNTTISIVASATSNIGVTKTEFYVNNNLICTDLTSPYTCQWKVPGKKTTYTITVKAYDPAGNTGQSSVKITVK